MFLALLLAFAAPVQQAPAPVPPAPAVAEDLVRVRLVTAEGPIVVALDRGRAPLTTANFLRYVDAKRLDEISFFRSMRLAWGPGLIQAGQHDPRRLYPPVAHEPTTRTGLTHTEGAISLARMAPGTGRADFSIMVGDMTGLDAKLDQPGDNAGYAVFGRVVEGMEVVKKIWAGPLDPVAGEGAMKGQMLKPGVKVLTVRREL